ncbi:MAG: cupredoxin domain-containing protein, partial [Candidatus Methylomirabilales bacterium]
MSQPARERSLLPLAVPLGILLFMAVPVIGFSRVMLAVPKEVAVAVALMMALNLMGLFSVLSARPRMGAPQALALLAVVAVPAVVGAAVGVGVLPAREEEGHVAGPTVVEISAQNIAFDKKEFRLQAGAPAAIKFTNNDAVPHNVAIYRGTDATGEKVLNGEIFGGPATREYEFTAPEAGSYYFRCDVHPNMDGTVVVEEKAAGPAGEGEAPGEAEISAENIAFDKNELILAAGGQVILKFTNNDTVPH